MSAASSLSPTLTPDLCVLRQTSGYSGKARPILRSSSATESASETCSAFALSSAALMNLPSAQPNNEIRANSTIPANRARKQIVQLVIEISIPCFGGLKVRRQGQLGVNGR